MARAVIILILLIVAGLACIFYFGMESPPVSLTLTSPNKTYVVHLDEHADRYLLPIHLDSRRFSSEVRFNAFKGGQSLAQNEMLWDDPSGGARFFDSYKYRWINDSVLKFGWDESVPQLKNDEVVVSNDTNRPINQLVVNANEHFLILDLQPKSSVKLSAYPQSWLSWVSCKGSFASGKSIPFDGVNFFIRDNRESHVSQHYCISIRDDELLIQSQEIEGYKEENGVKTTIPKCSNNPLMEVVFDNQR
jgi:hypothetical protein